MRTPLLAAALTLAACGGPRAAAPSATAATTSTATETAPTAPIATATVDIPVTGMT